jgi:hypothetical protein
MSVTPNPLITFEQFGFKLERENADGHAVGRCPFCGKEGHFSINKNSPNKVWDCKRCGRGGGFLKFLKEIVDMATEAPDLSALAANRGLKVSTLKEMGVGLINDRYVIPVFSWDGATILNIKIYDGDSFRNTAGCTSAMYGLWMLPRKDTAYDTVYIAEGEWDAMALHEMLKTTKEKNYAVIGVPGAGTFKQEAVQYFIGKKVYLMYDNDLAGRNGSRKAVNMLSQVASKITELIWPKDTQDGFDVRDVYTKQFKSSALSAMIWLKRNCKAIEVQENTEAGAEVDVNQAPIPVEEVYKVFKKWIHIGDNKSKDQKGTDIYDVVFGTILANRIPGSPVWMYVVAPPGGFKSEPLLACAGGKLIEMVESVTPPALISGMNVGGHEDPSLIAKINHKTLIIKDWTIILGLPEHERNEIMSILRGAFDGICGRNFGNGVRREIKSQFGILAAVTPVIEQYIEQTSAVGERFISWRNWLSDDIKVRKSHIRRALENSLVENDMKMDLGTIAKKVLIAKYPEPPKPREAVMEQVISMSEWIAAMRGTVSRDKYSRNKVMTHKPCTELGTRVSKEIMKWLMGVSLFKGDKEISQDSMRIAQSITRASVSQRNLDILSFLWKDKTVGFGRKDIEQAIGLPDETCDVLLDNMKALKILEKEVIDNKALWKIRPHFITLTEEAKVL